ncbi:MAG TPA: hypothetical protein ENM97_00225 [Moorella mulderi]|nr:hypothetical protein [Moorella mulderi]
MGRKRGGLTLLLTLVAFLLFCWDQPWRSFKDGIEKGFSVFRQWASGADTHQAEPLKCSVPVEEGSLALGLSPTQVTRILGEPSWTGASPQGETWWVYEEAGRLKMVVGFRKARVADFFTTSPSWEMEGFRVGRCFEGSFSPKVKMSYENMNFEFELKERSRILIPKKEGALILYLDNLDGNRITALRFCDWQHLIQGNMFNYTVTYWGRLPQWVKGVTPEDREEVARSEERLMHTLVNDFRLQKGLNALRWDDRAHQVALDHSRDMAQNNFFAHVSPTTKLDVAGRFNRAGINYSLVGENLAFGQPDPLEAHVCLLNSPGHRQNLLHPGYTRGAVGVVGRYFTIVFYRPWL